MATLERMQRFKQSYLELLLVLKLLLYFCSHQPPLLCWQCRLKATLERMQRFTESHLELLLKLLHFHMLQVSMLLQRSGISGEQQAALHWTHPRHIMLLCLLLQVEGHTGAHAALQRVVPRAAVQAAVLQMLTIDNDAAFVFRGCRLKATLERMQRFTESYLELLLKLLPPVAESLGKALGVAPYAIQTFTEAEIRANVVFQVMRISVSTLLCLVC
jgi:hypothetical protein